MGHDKASLVVGGSRMVDRVLGAVRESGVERIVVSGASRGAAISSEVVVADVVADSGPLAGVSASWAHLREQALRPVGALVLSCDLPSINHEVIDALLQASNPPALGAIANDGERDQPLVAAYTADMLDEAVGAFAAGQRSLRKLHATWALDRVVLVDGSVLDADTPDDLAGFDVAWPKKPEREVGDG